MARPWYIQAMDASHRLTVLGILGFSGYLTFIAFKGIEANAMRKAHKKLEEPVEAPQS